MITADDILQSSIAQDLRPDRDMRSIRVIPGSQCLGDRYQGMQRANELEFAVDENNSSGKLVAKF